MTYNPNKAKDGKMASEGGSWALHNENLHDETGKKRERSPSEDIHVRRGLGKSSVPLDETEQWLRKNDPDYNVERNWNG